MDTPAVSGAAAVPPSAPVSIFGRLVAVFVRPAQAWGGLDTRVQWWFPILLIALVQTVSGILLYDRAILPMITERWEQAVDSGQMTAEQMTNAEQMMSQPVWRVVTVVQQVIVWFLMVLISALGVWFGAGFVLGSRMKYRHALEVVSWASLVMIPAMVLTSALAWSRETLQGVHVGFAALLPAVETPGKLDAALRVFLDGVGPFAIWYVVVAVLGASALSGAARRPVAWVVSGIYLLLLLLIAGLSAVFTPAA